MPSTPPLLVVRNTLGRLVGAATAYTPAQRATARAIFDFWSVLPACGPLVGAMVCANTDGETSFLLDARGDAKMAGGMCQWHGDRRALIKTRTGVDVWVQTDPLSQCHAMLAETSERWSAYRHVLPCLQAAVAAPGPSQPPVLVADQLRAGVAVLVNQLEQSGSRARDVDRRTAMAVYWYGQFAEAA